MNNYVIILIGFLGLLSNIVSTKGGLYDRRRKFHRMLTKRGWTFVLLGLPIIALTAWQYFQVKNEDQRKEETAKINQRTADSTIASEIKKGVDSNRIRLFNDLSEALGKQNLRFDSLNKSFERITTATSNSSKEIQSYVTGGSTYPDIDIIPQSGTEARIVLQTQGKYPLYDLEMLILDIDTVNKNSLIKNLNIKVGNVMPNPGTLYPGIIKSDFTNRDSKLFYVYSSARNGRFNQFIGLKKVEGKWIKSMNRIMNVQTSTELPSIYGSIP